MSQRRRHYPENVALGVMVIVVTVCAMAFGDALVKYISADFTLWQIFVLRSLAAMPILTALLLLNGSLATIRPKSIGWTMLRSMLLVAMWIAFGAALPVLSLPVVAAAYYTGPLFITLFSALLIGEPVRPRRWMAVSIGFVGVLVILRPGTDAFSFFTLLPILSALLYALAAIITRTGCVDENPFVLSLALNISFMAVGAIAMGVIGAWEPTASQAGAYPFLLGQGAIMHSREWGIIALLAVLIVAISSGVAKAYQSAPPAIIATFDYSYLAFAAFWSFVFFADLPDAVTGAGMLLIAGAGLLAVAPAGSARRAAKA